MLYNEAIKRKSFNYYLEVFCLDNAYKQLLEKKKSEREAMGLNFIKEKVSNNKTLKDIYSEIAFGEMPILKKTL